MSYVSPRGSRKTGGAFHRPILVVLQTSLFLLLFFGLCLDRSLAGAQTASNAAGQSQGNAQNGKQVFTMQGCYKCHGNDAQGMSAADNQNAGPRIGPTRLGLAAFLRFVRNPTGKMLPFSTQDVSDAALTDVFAFLQSLAQAPQANLAPGNAQNGQTFFHDYGCYECHGGQGQGAANRPAANRLFLIPELCPPAHKSNAAIHQ
jgi:mono/diheme cytochrome c family protein